MTNIRRIIKHLFMAPWLIRKVFPNKALAAIGAAIHTSEATHLGEIRFAVESALHGLALLRGQSARDRAIEVFSELRIWDTEHNTGVLIYLQLAERRIEIIADRGIHAKVGQQEWASICHGMETALAQGNYETGVLRGIAIITGHLKKHFPASTANPNELSDNPVVL